MATIRRQVKNMVKNYSEAEVKVREATSNDPWGPSTTLMSEISDLTYNIVALGEVMRMIWKRLNDHGKNWRHVYKSLVLLDYLIKNGNEKVAQQCKEHIVAIQTLKDFQFMDEQKDQGQSVREKAKQLVNLLRDDERLKIERSKAFTVREKFARNAMGIYPNVGLGPNGKQALGVSSRTNGGNYADPYGGSKQLAAEIEAVRPSDPNEEDLQIKLAIMLSQQEHEDEEQKRRNDEAKLQIALEQSKTEGQPNGLLDLDDFGGAFDSNNKKNNQHDPWASTQNKKTNSNNEDTDSDDFFPPMRQSSNDTNGKQNILDDPWATPLPPFNKPTQATTSTLKDPWNNTGNNLNSQTNPWMPTNTAIKDPWATSNTNMQNTKIDDFDLFTTNRVKTPSSPITNTPANQKMDPFGDFFGNSPSAAVSSSNDSSTNPWNSSSSKTDDQKPPVSSSTKPNNDSSIRKTPESFLGENSSLVNLENLIPSRPKSTNPFGDNRINNGLSTSTSIGQLNNPFLAQQALQNGTKPSINQLQQQQQQQNQSSPLYPSLFNNSNMTSHNNSLFLNNTPAGQLAQPLIVPPRPSLDIGMNGGVLMPTMNSVNNNMFLPSNTNNVNSTNPFLAM